MSAVERQRQALETAIGLLEGFAKDVDACEFLDDEMHCKPTVLDGLRAALEAAPSPPDLVGEPIALDVDDLAQEIRRVDGKHSLGAGALAEALMPFLSARIRSCIAAPARGGLTRRLVSVNEYARDYYFAADGGDYTPNEGEQAMIEDAIEGYLAQAEEAERLAPPAPAEGNGDRDKLVEAAEKLIGIVEGIQMLDYGTFRAERNQVRLKDTKEWVELYLAAKAARAALATEGSAP